MTDETTPSPEAWKAAEIALHSAKRAGYEGLLEAVALALDRYRAAGVEAERERCRRHVQRRDRHVEIIDRIQSGEAP